MDLSKENVEKTILQNKKAKDIDYKYSNIELVFTDEKATKFKVGGIVPKTTFLTIYGEKKVLSTHDYDDTRTTSVLVIGI